MKHTGALIFWHNQRWTVTGTYAQCEAAIDDAQSHSMTAGWWSIGSLLVWNWVALRTNRRARADLQAQRSWYAAHRTDRPAPAARRRRWPAVAVTGAVLVVLALLLGAVGALVGDPEPPTADFSAPLTASARPLAGLLLSPDDVAKALSIATITDTTPADHLTVPYGDHIVDNDCVSAFYPATTAFYNNTGWTALRTAHLRDPADGPLRHSVEQAVLSYPGPPQRMTAAAHDIWQACSGRTINIREVTKPDAVDALWRVGEVTDTDGILALSLSADGTDDWGCRRGLAVAETVVIDVQACGHDLPGSVIPTLIDPIRAKITG
ncbi:sensor domain-containing protein [Mycolicibacillus trivialis]|uniref:PknH-like extracellular domain-containing protein n=1 Tax=Mycolicibacillus trivialis TaxID=1798 RepID=A0A1X2EN31_9MYCO|nr:sensor domain-containing protein [Mycolicibacillus trivialis]ORX06928.1 hypothetical protein AWC30_04995 [Mycolicibacillus trivialis]